MKQSLYEKLAAYSKSDVYPFHMPGHKRQCNILLNPYELDITEIADFDDLHHPEGILRDSQQMAAQIYGVKKSYYLINGSTAGIMIGISACVKPGETVLIAGNCHRSAWNAAFLRGLKIKRLNPFSIDQKDVMIKTPVITGETTVSSWISPETVLAALQEDPNIKAVIITSPTYEGVVSPIREIAEVTHAFGIPLIVDEAHGAHFPFAAGCGQIQFPNSALEEEADLVIQSLHKTLPSLTQTAIMHVNGRLVDIREVDRFYSIYQTSSPSYILLASIDACIHYMQGAGQKQMDWYANRIKQFWDRSKEWKALWFLYRDLDVKSNKLQLDPSKVVFGSCAGTGGMELMQRMREEFHLECEMCQESYVIAMTTLMDSEEGFNRLEEALDALNREESLRIQNGSAEYKSTADAKRKAPIIIEETVLEKDTSTSSAEHLQEIIWVAINHAAGRYAADQIAIYPPGIPFVFRGEEITGEHVAQIIRALQNGFRLDGVRKKSDTQSNEMVYEVAVIEK